jgi:ATP-binding cassette, subfamily D (ALD), member 3
MAKAIGKIVISYKDVQALAGYTTLIHELDEVLYDLNRGKFRRTQIAEVQGGKVESFKLIDMSSKGEVIVGENLEF